MTPTTRPLADWLGSASLINLLCAEELGWHNVRPNPTGVTRHCGTHSPTDNAYYAIPDFADSLDACASLRDSLTDEEWIKFHKNLRRVTFGDKLSSHFHRSLNATALQISVAFLLTKNRIAINP